MTTHEVLVRARNLISDEKDWCKGGLARSQNDPEAPRCGAISPSGRRRVPSLVGWTESAFAYVATRRAMGRVLGCGPAIEKWNDSHSHAEVLAAFDKAIAATAPEPDTEFLNNVAEPVAA
jgi:hypothetical protein